MWQYSQGDMNRCLLLMVDQFKDTANVQFVEPVNFRGVIYRSMYEGYLQKWLAHSWITKDHLSMGDTPWKLENLQARQ